MKKLLAILLALVMLLGLSAAAMAEEAEEQRPLLSWMSARRLIEQNGLEGAFYQVGSLNCDLWVPAQLQPVEAPDGAYCAFATEDGAVSITVNHLFFESDPTLEDIEEVLPDWGCVSSGVYWINDILALVYENAEEDTLSALVLLGEGDAMEFVFTPVSNQQVYSLTSLVLCTIQLHELDAENVALMIDADLNGVWGAHRDLRVTETDEGQEIRIFLWDEGVNSETIQSVNNWDSVKANHVALYNFYAEALEGLGMGGLDLTMMYISPEEEISFLTISGGEILYDVFEDAA